jgi:glycosyltransferase involved in cell wall biosynthesis
MTVAVLMPAYNEATRVGETLAILRSGAARLGGIQVFLVDDGGEPAISLSSLPPSTSDFRIVLARHALNLGQGAALETARQLALREGSFAAYVTMDSDGQHDLEGVAAVVAAVRDGADVALGSRFMGGSKVPKGRRALLHAARLFEWMLTGRRLADAHNGLRAFNRRVLENMPIRQSRMAHATEITKRVLGAGSWAVVEIPVKVSYTPECSQKGQRATAALQIVNDLVSHYLFGDSP